MPTAAQPINHATSSNRTNTTAIRAVLLLLIVAALLAPAAGVGASDEVTVEGEVILEHADFFADDHSEEYLILETTGGARYRLEGRKAEQVRENTRIRVRGKKRDDTLVLAADSSVTTLSGSTSTSSAGEVVAASSTTKKVAVLLVNFTDPEPPPTASPTVDPSWSPDPEWTPSPSPSPTAPPPPPPTPWTKSQVRGIYFTNTRSVANYFSEVSNGKLNITGEVFGWYTLTSKTNSCKYSEWGTMARQAASNAGVNLSGYDHIVTAFPRVSACPWGGLAQVFGKYNWINGSMTPYVTIHELGHNFGAHHASTISCTSGGKAVTLSGNCTTSEYGDPFDVMGQNASGPSNQRHMHTWHRKQVGLLGTSDQLTVTKNGHYTLAVAQVNGGTPRILRVARNSSEYYYLEFRQPYGVFDDYSSTSGAVSGVLVRIAPNTSRVQSKLLDMNPSTTTFSDAALQPGKTFSHGDISITTVSISPSGAVLRIQVGPDTVPPTTPGNFKAALNTSTSVRLTWTASTDDLVVTGYRIRRDGATVATVNASTLSYTDLNLTQGVTYNYTVQALDGTNASAAASAAIQLPDTIAPSAPADVTAQQTGQRQVTVSWGPATDNGVVVQYRVRRDGSLLAKTSSLSYVDNSVVDGKSYKYEVRAEDAAGNLGPNAAATPATLALSDMTPPSAPGNLSASAASTSSIKLSWTAASDNVGVSGYRVWRNGELAATLGGSATSYTDASLDTGSYQYSVAAFDAAGNEGPKSSASLTLATASSSPATPKNFSGTAQPDRYVKLSWDASTGGTGTIEYRIFRDDVRIATVKTLEYVDRTPGVAKYSYKIRAVDASSNKSAFSSSISVTSLGTTSTSSTPSVPAGLKATSLERRYIQLSWTASTGGSGTISYRIFRNDVRIATVTGTTFTDRPASTGTYTYKIRAVDSKGNKSAFTPKVTAKAVRSLTTTSTTPSVPSNFKGSSLDRRYIQLSWTASTGGSGTIEYRIFRDGVRIAKVTTTSYKDRPASVGTYSYKVRAVDSKGNKSAFTSVIKVKAVRAI